MSRHDVEHTEIARWKAKVDRDQAIVDDPASDYNKRGAAQASLNVFAGPGYHNALDDHLRYVHHSEPDDPWAYASELEEQHDALHKAAMPPCEKVEDPQDVGEALEASLRERGVAP